MFNSETHIITSATYHDVNADLNNDDVENWQIDLELIKRSGGEKSFVSVKGRDAYHCVGKILQKQHHEYLSSVST